MFDEIRDDDILVDGNNYEKWLIGTRNTSNE